MTKIKPLPFICMQEMDPNKGIKDPSNLPKVLRYVYESGEVISDQKFAWGGNNRISLDFVSLNVDEWHQVETSKQIEYAAIESLMRNGTIGFGHKPEDDEITVTHPCNIIQAANRIAAKTRRGAGNTVLLHKDDVLSYNFFTHQFGELPFKYFTTDYPGMKNKIAMMYRGYAKDLLGNEHPYDGGPIMVTYGNRWIGFAWKDAQPYVRILDFPDQQLPLAIEAYCFSKR